MNRFKRHLLQTAAVLAIGFAVVSTIQVAGQFLGTLTPAEVRGLDEVITGAAQPVPASRADLTAAEDDLRALEAELQVMLDDLGQRQEIPETVPEFDALMNRVLAQQVLVTKMREGRR